jgi:hypothetical protein
MKKGSATAQQRAKPDSFFNSPHHRAGGQTPAGSPRHSTGGQTPTQSPRYSNAALRLLSAYSPLE